MATAIKTVRTIAELRAHLDEVEKTWSDLDRKYLGDFGLQKVLVPYFDEASKFHGYGPPVVGLVDTTSGFTFETPKDSQ